MLRHVTHDIEELHCHKNPSATHSYAPLSPAIASKVFLQQAAGFGELLICFAEAEPHKRPRRAATRIECADLHGAWATNGLLHIAIKLWTKSDVCTRTGSGVTPASVVNRWQNATSSSVLPGGSSGLQTGRKSSWRSFSILPRQESCTNPQEQSTPDLCAGIPEVCHQEVGTLGRQDPETNFLQVSLKYAPLLLQRLSKAPALNR